MKRFLLFFISISVLLSNLSLAEEVSQKDSMVSDKFYKKSVNYGARGNLIEAEEQIRKSLELNKFNQSAISILEIIEDYKKGIISPEYTRCLFTAFTYSNKKNFEEAIAKLNEAIQIDSKYPSAYLNLGLLYILLGDNENAIANYKKAVEVRPSAKAYHGLASAYGYAKQHQKAIETSLKSLEINPNYALSYFNLGVSYWSLKKYDKAEKSIQKAKELFIQQENISEANSMDFQLERLHNIIEESKGVNP